MDEFAIRANGIGMNLRAEGPSQAVKEFGKMLAGEYSYLFPPGEIVNVEADNLSDRKSFRFSLERTIKTEVSVKWDRKYGERTIEVRKRF